MSQFQQNFITVVIERYGLELDGHQVETIVVDWLQKYDHTWIVKAILESLYRGRYKIKSVDNILRDWQRLGKPCHRFTPEFEREILQNLPAIADLVTSPPVPTVLSPGSNLAAEEDRSNPHFPAVQSAVHSSKNLNPEESAPFQHHNHSVPAAQHHNIRVGMVQTSASSHLICNSQADESNSIGSIPLSSSAMIERKNASSEKFNSKIKSSRIISPPAKFQLFHTLKAIVDPKNHQQVEVEKSVCLPSIDHQNHHRIAKFKLTLENGEEQHV
jgi:hypothetical protein